MSPMTPDSASSFTRIGTGPALVCVAGGPLRNPAYLGTLGGLDADRTLIIVDLPHQRADHLVDMLESVRAELGSEQLDLLVHSAGATLGLYYAARHPDRVRRLLLVTPGTRAVAIAPSDADWDARLAARSDEPWYPEAQAAMQAWDSGDDSAAVRAAAAPFMYGRWDQAAAAHASGEVNEVTPGASQVYYAAGRPEPDDLRAELSRVAAPVLVLTGGLDPSPDEAIGAELAGLFPAGRQVVQPGAGHYPWLDDAGAFRVIVLDFFSTDPH